MKNKRSLKEKMVKLLDIPAEIALDVPKIVLTGNQSITIENYKGVIEYTDLVVRVKTINHVLRVTGRCLDIKTITSEELLITGSIQTLEFIS